jgi:hypothetical protein
MLVSWTAQEALGISRRWISFDRDCAHWCRGVPHRIMLGRSTRLTIHPIISLLMDVGSTLMREARMMNSLVRAVFLVWFGIVLSATAYAESKYNPYTRKWEDVSPDAVPRVNPVTGHWELASPSSVPKLNPYTRQYELVSPNSITRFNPYSKQWELAPPDAKLELNPYTNSWHYTR